MFTPAAAIVVVVVAVGKQASMQGRAGRETGKRTDSNTLLFGVLQRLCYTFFFHCSGRLVVWSRRIRTTAANNRKRLLRMTRGKTPTAKLDNVYYAE